MARPLRIEFPGAIYHVTASGNARHAMFYEDADRELFLVALQVCVGPALDLTLLYARSSIDPQISIHNRDVKTRPQSPRRGAMIRAAMVLSMFVAGLLVPGLSQGSDATLETSHLIVSDATGKLSNEQLKRLADHAQEMLNKILAFWSADPGIGRFGKIRVVFQMPRRDVYSSVFYWDKKDGRPARIVGVFGTEGSPQMMAHKLTSAVFPQKDKLIRNMMGILTEAQVGNPLTFPMCGFGSDEWVLALLRTKSYVPLNDLGPDHESWGMRDAGGGRLSIHDKAKQHKAYAETGSFGNYLFQSYGISKIKQFHRLSHEKDRPSQDVFGISMQELEANWLKTLRANEKTREEKVSTVLKLFERDPGTACAEAQKLVSRER